MKIAIVTNYQSEELFAKCREFCKESKYDHIGISGKGGFYGWSFLDHITKTLDHDWVILVDEDCFITDIKAVEALLEFQINNNIHCSGVPDGGVVNTRKHNPTSINCFFSILNLGEIRKIYNTDAANRCQPMVEKFKHLTPHKIMKSVNPFAYDGFEPYYRYFFWLHENGFNTLFLDGSDYYHDADIWTSIVKFNGNSFAYHTWMAREYDKSATHRARIDKVYNHCKEIVRDI